jgi:sporulation protein YlmC with PRC-barrel domain
MLRFQDRDKASKKRALCSAIVTIALLVPAGFAVAQVSGTTTLGITEVELKDVINGVSAKRHVLGKDVYNDKNEVVGKAEDLILSRERAVSYVILGAGGFLGIGEHDVVIPVNQFKMAGDKLVLSGATKESIRAMPRFEYSRK